MSPVDPEDVPDYYEVVEEPMDLETMRQKVDTHRYETKDMFLADINLIKHNAELYNPANVRP